MLSSAAPNRKEESYLESAEAHETSPYERFLSARRVNFPTFLDARSTSPVYGKISWVITRRFQRRILSAATD